MRSGEHRLCGRHQRAALTLVEVLVSSVLLGVGVAGLLSVATLAMRNLQRSEHRAAALCLAQEKLAEVEVVGPHTWSTGHPLQGTQSQGTVTYGWTLTLDPLAAGELYSVLVEVRWSGPGGNGAVQLETWLNDYAAVTLEPPAQPRPGPAGPPQMEP